ncbi:hypothetical protein [Marinitoga lauensis]|uniref:hypothetical protein n=1 Tax=Marinitoga lauensis TaxID=2201189 RepID=UPI00197D4904|nr:hypothetical protein [Marinitoga lauensis]
MYNIKLNLALIKNLEYKINKEGWFLETVLLYCNAIEMLVNTFNSEKIQSEGLSIFKNFILKYSKSNYFISLKTYQMT